MFSRTIARTLCDMAGVPLRSVPRTAAYTMSNETRHSYNGARAAAQVTTSCHHRGLHSTAAARLAAKTIKDPNHPDGLYFHPLSDIKRYAISLLPTPPSSSDRPSIIAFIDDHDKDGAIYDVAVRKPDLVQTHAPFITLLHDVLKNEAVPQDGLLEYEAYLRKDGFAHVSDPRHPLMPGRIPTPENIIAMVAFTDSTIRPDSYQPNDVYRIVTSEEGFIQLRPNWLDLVQQRCEKEN